jgi:hypothetical protein
MSKTNSIMFSLKCILYFLLTTSALIISKAQSQPQPTPSVSLEDLFKNNSYNITVSNGHLSGAGLDFLMNASADAQFFAFAEQHNNKEIPEITAMLFDALHQRHGFNYLALEQDPVIAQMVSAKSVVGKRDSVVSLANQYPNAFTFITDQELEMIVRAGSTSNGKGNRIWGLDQAFGALHILNRLRELTSNTDVRNRLSGLIKIAQEFETNRYEKGRHFMTPEVPKPDDLINLLQIYQPKKGSEAEYLITQLLTSIRIYDSRKLSWYESSYMREENMKELFMRGYRKAQAAGERMPKALIKMGHYHIMRGINPSNVFTLGNFASEFAKSNNMNSFVMTMWVNNASGYSAWMPKDENFKAMVKVAPTNRWTVIDFRPLRSYVSSGKVQDINDSMRHYIFAYDAALIIGGGAPGTYQLTANKFVKQ